MSLFGVSSPSRKQHDDKINIISQDDTLDSNSYMSDGGGIHSQQKRQSNTRYSAASNFYDSYEVHPGLLKNADLSETIDDMKAHNVKLSQRLPQRLKKILAVILGIKRRPDDSLLCGLLLHTFTVILSIIFAITGAWYKIFDIKSELTKTTVVTGAVSLVIGIAWVSLGIYAHDLGGRLLSSRIFSENVRMHSKTIFRVSVAVLLLILGAVTIALDCYETYIMVDETTCNQVEIPVFVCYLSYSSKIGISIFTLMWNIMVGYIVLSVCRTHTVVIRKFMRELAIDAKAIEKSYFNEAIRISQSTFEESSAFLSPERLKQGNINSDYADNWIMWDEEDLLDQAKPRKKELRSVSDASGSPTKSQSKLGEGQDKNEEIKEDTNESSETEKTPQYQQPERNITAGTSILSNEDLLISYWKISRRMRVTSRYLQRWMASWILFVFIWCTDLIIYWTSHEATVPGILQFTLPLLMLLLISSAYAEANAEGQRMLRCICPREERLGLVFFLSQQPLQMQVFNFGITYQALTGVLLAFSVAFASRMILDEVNK